MKAQPSPKKRVNPGLSEAEWEERFQKLVDPNYYERDARAPRSMTGSTLSGEVFHVARPSTSRKKGAA